MYASIRDWVNIPVTIKPFLRRTATGDKVFGEPVEVLCYPKGEVKVVRNWQGVEIISMNHLYFDSTVTVTKLDNIVFEGEDLPVQAIENFYRNGAIDIKVVYL